jgi:histidyl-tRNA synthetase
LDAFVVPVGHVQGAARRKAAELTTALRRSGVRTDIAYGDRSTKSAMKSADRSGAPYVVVIGDRDLEAGVAQLKDMKTGEQHAVPLDDLVTRVVDLKEQLS